MTESRQNGRNPMGSYDVVADGKNVLYSLLADTRLAIPSVIRYQAQNVEIHGEHKFPIIPTCWRETEAITAVKALEACIALAVHDLSSSLLVNKRERRPRALVSSDHSTLQLFHSYLSTINGHGKWDSNSLPFLKPTDIHKAQSNLYRRLSANIYETKDAGVYYHTHGSLQATPILNALGLPGFLEKDPTPAEYDNLCIMIGDKVRKYSSSELDTMTVQLNQAGAPALTESDFLGTAQGQAMKDEPVISVKPIRGTWKPSPMPFPGNTTLLKGIKVLDMTRVIAGPSISRTLAEYGASVLKVTSPNLPDVPWYAVDLNFGKHTTDLDLKNSEDRATFENLLEDVDVLVDGYRPGSLSRLGYGIDELTERFKDRDKGFVYVAENCFGHVGPWSQRSGWQPIADAVSGLAWGHGEALQKHVPDVFKLSNEKGAQPVLPPFPMSDYGTGAIGAVGALLALHKRTSEGGSYKVDVSLVGWNLWVQSLGQLPESVQGNLFREHKEEMKQFKINHLSNFDVVSKAAIGSMRRLSPNLFDEKYMFGMKCEGFKGGVVKSMRPVVQYQDIDNTFEEGKETRPNGYDKSEWW